MAFCPECQVEIPANSIQCSSCGYDFDASSVVVTPRRPGFAYSTFADFALLASMVAAVIGACGAVLGAIMALLDGDLLLALIAYPIAFVLQIGMLVVFLRVQQ